MLSLLMKDETADQIHLEQRKIFNYKLGQVARCPGTNSPKSIFTLEPAARSQTVPEPGRLDRELPMGNIPETVPRLNAAGG